MSSFSVDGLVSGLSTSQLIDELMALESRGQSRATQKRDKTNTIIGLFQSLNTKFTSIKSAADALDDVTGWKPMKASSSDSTYVTASASSGALGASLSFKVNQLAKAHSLIHPASFASTSAASPWSTPLLAGKAGSLGFDTITATGSMSPGDYTLEVTQASAGAASTGNNVVAGSVTVASGATFNTTQNGTSVNYNIPAGTYTPLGLAEAIETASGGALYARLNTSGRMVITTAREGSAASLTVRSTGTVNGLAGFSSNVASSGTNGIVSWNGTSKTITDIRPDGSNSTTLTSAAGDATVTFLGGLRIGSTTIKAINTGTTVASAVTAINSANLGFTASAVSDGEGQVRLQMASSTTGTAGAITTSSVFADLISAQDAELIVGEGAGAYTVTSSSNTTSSVLQGVTLTLLKADPTKTISIDVTQDSSQAADKVQALVSAANEAIQYIKDQTKYVPTASGSTISNSGPLLGDPTFQRLQSDLISAINAAVAGSSLNAASSVGITLGPDGNFVFDKTKFQSSYDADPEGVTKLFIEGGTAGPPPTSTSPGIAERLRTLADNATKASTGILTAAIAGKQAEVTSLEKIIADWDIRLEKKRDALKRQFTAMEVALQRMQAQSSQLAGALANLTAQTGG